jgi:hypothetical protein
MLWWFGDGAERWISTTWTYDSDGREVWWEAEYNRGGVDWRETRYSPHSYETTETVSTGVLTTVRDYQDVVVRERFEPSRSEDCGWETVHTWTEWAHTVAFEDACTGESFTSLEEHFTDGQLTQITERSGPGQVSTQLDIEYADGEPIEMWVSKGPHGSRFYTWDHGRLVEVRTARTTTLRWSSLGRVSAVLTGDDDDLDAIDYALDGRVLGGTGPVGSDYKLVYHYGADDNLEGWGQVGDQLNSLQFVCHDAE